MNADQIRALKPGPELDRAVAETLFQAAIFEDKAGNVYVAVRDGAASVNIPRYSSTWIGLGLVVEEMERRGWLPDIDADQASGGPIIYTAKFWHGWWGIDLLEISHESTDRFMAVCKAALLAIAAERAGRGEG